MFPVKLRILKSLVDGKPLYQSKPGETKPCNKLNITLWDRKGTYLLTVLTEKNAVKKETEKILK
jgi:hypothetical protein